MRLQLAISTLALCLSPLTAQGLQFDVTGGSIPGTLSFDLYPTVAPLTACFILTGITPGPTNIALFDPADPRTVNVGTQALGNSFFGLSGLDGHFRVGPLAVPNIPSLTDAAFFFQGITIGGATTIVDQISLARAVRLAPSGAFHTRSAYMLDERAFATVLPRTDGSWTIAGGGRGALLAQVAHRTTEIYDPLTDSFTFGPNMNVERSIHTATRLNDGRWLIAGGVAIANDPQSLCEIYDPATGTFTQVASMVTPRMGHTANLLPNGRVLVTGGLQALTVLPTQLSAIRDATNLTEIYDPVANTWTPGPNLRTPRAGHISFQRPDGKVVLAGGISWDSVILLGWLPAMRSSVDIYDPVTNTISAGPSMANTRSLTYATEITPGRFLVAGGIAAISLTNPGNPTAAAEIYNSATNSWSSAGSMAAARANHLIIPLGNGRFLHAGGADGSVLNPNALGTTEVYDANTNSWSAGPSLTVPRAAYALYQTPTDQVMLFGGGTTLGAIATSTEWWYR